MQGGPTLANRDALRLDRGAATSRRCSWRGPLLPPAGAGGPGVPGDGGARGRSGDGQGEPGHAPGGPGRGCGPVQARRPAPVARSPDPLVGRRDAVNPGGLRRTNPDQTLSGGSWSALPLTSACPASATFGQICLDLARQVAADLARSWSSPAHAAAMSSACRPRRPPDDLLHRRHEAGLMLKRRRPMPKSGRKQRGRPAISPHSVTGLSAPLQAWMTCVRQAADRPG